MITTLAEEPLCNTDERLDLARSLVLHLEAGDEDDINSIINRLYNEKEQSLFQEIGKLTRQLHDALGTCRNDERISSLAERDMPDARERLRYVMTKTEESAHKTLGAVESALPLSDRLMSEAAEMTREWERFKRREMSAEDFRKLSKKLEEFLQSVNTGSRNINDSLSVIMMAQDYQDLTGQIISRVISIVEEVEQGLVGMIQDCGQVDTARKKEEPDIAVEGPQIHTNGRSDTVQNQDDVDDLLSSLGF